MNVEWLCWLGCAGIDTTDWLGQKSTGEKLTVRVAVTGKCPYIGINKTAVVQVGKELYD